MSVDQSPTGDVAEESTVVDLRGEHSLPILPTDPTPSRIGRFVVIGMLGRGGMGVVVSAYDPELERKVAIKLVGRAGAVAESRQRMKREALALAKLAHPNVVAVYDVGELDGGLYIAMEHVDGTTLAGWLERVRPLPTILSRFIDAGAGLAAAHEAGLVHRDFKPANILLGDDGRVRVGDFGLARGDAVATPSGLLVDASELLSNDVTRDGVVLGTPAYMAPEQIRSEDVDARCDQFSFCVSLWEAVTGERPFPVDDLEARYAAIGDGRIRDPTRVPPRWLERTLRRGMAFRPKDRHADMAVLLEILRRTPARRRVLVYVLAGAAVLASAVGVVLDMTHEQDAVCVGGQEQIGEAYDERDRDAIERSLLATELAMAPEVAQRVTARLDGLVGSWARAHDETCDATLVRQERSQESFDETLSCLADVRRQIDRRVEILRGANEALTRNALDLLDTIADPERCTNADALARRRSLEPRPEIREEVDELNQDYDRLLTERIVRPSFTRREEAWTELLSRAEVLDHQPLVAKLLVQRANTRRIIGQYVQGEEDFSRAFGVAIAAGDTMLAEGIAIRIAYGYDYQGKPQEVARWLDLAAEFARQVDLPPLREAELERTRAELLFHGADTPRAIAMLRAVIDRVKDEPPTHARDVFLARLAMTISRSLDQDWQPEAALAAAREGEVLLREALGAHHPRYADALGYRAAALLKLQRGAEALELFERIREINEDAGSKGGPSERAIVGMQISVALRLTGRMEEAVAEGEAAVELAAEAGPGRVFGWALARHCLALEAAEELDEALDVCERSLDHFRSTIDADPNTQPNARGELIFALGRVGRVRLRRGELGMGRILLEEAMELAETDPEDRPTRLAFSAKDLAWALLLQGEDRSRAESLVRLALEHLEPKYFARERAEFLQMLASYDMALPE